METQDPKGEEFGNYFWDSEGWAGPKHMAEVIALTPLLHRAVQDTQHGLPAQWEKSQSIKIIFLFYLRKEHVICTVSIKWAPETWQPGHGQVMLQVKVNLRECWMIAWKKNNLKSKVWYCSISLSWEKKKQFLAGRSFSSVLARELTPPSGNHFVL